MPAGSEGVVQHEMFGGACAHCAVRSPRDGAVARLIDAARKWVEVQRFSETHRWALYYQRRDAAEAALTQAVAALDGPTVKDSLTVTTPEESSEHDADSAAGGA